MSHGRHRFCNNVIVALLFLSPPPRNPKSWKMGRSKMTILYSCHIHSRPWWWNAWHTIFNINHLWMSVACSPQSSDLCFRLLGFTTSHLSIGRCVEPPSGRLFFEPELWRASTSKKSANMIANRLTGVWTLWKHLPLKNTLCGEWTIWRCYDFLLPRSQSRFSINRPIGSSMIISPRIFSANQRPPNT